jgi:hypothetical protein
MLGFPPLFRVRTGTCARHLEADVVNVRSWLVKECLNARVATLKERWGSGVGWDMSLVCQG